jgi:three-Cys-motif partner protein
MLREPEYIKPWSKDKLHNLAQYLEAYSTIMNSKKRKWLRSFAYIDAFASIGAYLDPNSEEREYVNGSPRRALECQPPFDTLWFIERSHARIEALKEELGGEWLHRDIRFSEGDANVILRDEILGAFTWDAYQRVVVFLDPYGLDVDFETVEALAQAKVFDIFVNFSTMGVTRLCPRGKCPDDTSRQKLLRVLGDVTWIDDLYVTQLDMFGDDQMTRGRLDPRVIAFHYADRLRNGLFEHVSEPVLMRNSTNSPLYILFVASHHEQASKIANDIFARYERLRAVRQP